MTTANGKPETIEAACSAPKPPAANSTAAITPSVPAQNKRWIFGGLVSPPEVSISITKLAESDEVTNQRTIITTISPFSAAVSGYDSINLKIALPVSARTAPTSPGLTIFGSTAAISSICTAEPPKAVNHKNKMVIGINNTPKINSRMVRPREIRATNTPTNGDQLIHHAQ